MSEEQAKPGGVAKALEALNQILVNHSVARAFAEVYAKMREHEAEAEAESKPETWRDRAIRDPML